MRLATDHGFTMRAARRTGALLLGALCALALSGCNAEQELTPPDAPAGGAGAIQMVPTLANEFDLVDNAELTINGAIWNQAAPYGVGTGSLNPFLGVQGQNNDYDDNPDTEEGFNSDVSPNDLEGDGKRQNFTSSLPLNQVPVITVNNVAYREFILDANEANNDPAAHFSIDRFDLWYCVDNGAPAFDQFTDFRTNANCQIVYDLDGDKTPATDLKRALATDANSKGSGNSWDYQILIPDALFAAIPATAGCPYNPLAQPCGVYLVLDTKMGGKGGDYVIGSTFEEFSTVERGFVAVTKTAVTSLTRTYTWDLEKKVVIDGVDQDNGSIILAPDQVYSQGYKVTASVTGSTDGNWAVTGVITVTNPDGSDQTVSVASVTDVIEGLGPVPVDCGAATFPHLLVEGASLVCSYSSTLPDATNRLNTATALLTDLGTGIGTANIGFPPAAENITHADNCITVKDIGDLGNHDPLGVVCAPDTPAPDGAYTAPKTFEYSWEVLTGSAQCGENRYENLASGTTNTSGTVLDDAAWIDVTINCTTGCTLTQGYWKTHNGSFHGGASAKADPTWELLGALKEATGFFTTVSSYPVAGPNAFPAFSWFNVFWTAPAGNAYYNLAHQYMAAKLNQLSGAAVPADVATALTTAQGLFVANTPAAIGALKGNNALRKQFVDLAGTLGGYNEGDIGPGHCSEDSSSQ